MMTNDTASRLAAPTIASEITDFSTIASNVSYQNLGTAYPAGSVLSQDNIAGTGWDVTAQSSVQGKAFLIRGINANGNGDGDTTSIRFQANDIDYVTFKSHAGGFYFDLSSFAIRNTAAASFTVQALDAGGNPVGAAVPFSIGASPIGSPFTTVSLAGHPDFVGIYGFKVNLTSGTDEPFFDNLIVANIGIPGAPALPTTTVDTASLRDDTGALDDDFVTNVAAQTIDGTLNAALASGEKVQVSYDGGLSWSDATGYTVGARNWSTGTTLSGSDTFMARVSNADGSSTAFEHDYTLDTAAPSAPPAPDLRVADDTGNRDDDDITSATAPTITGSAEDGTSVTLYDTDGVSVLGTAIASGGAWSITSSALGQGTHGLSVTATDLAGNESVRSTVLQLTIDAGAPTALALSATGASTGGAGSGAALATLSASDSTAVTYALATGDGANDAHNGSFTILGNSLQVGHTPLGAGIYRIYLSATDAAGNISYLAQAFTVHDVPGVVSIVRAGGADSGLPADRTAAIYTVTFSEDVTGVDAGDFVLTGSGSAGGAIALVEGSGKTYTVTVTGLAGDGALRLDLKGSGTGIQSGAGVAIGGGFTAGETYLLDRTAPDTPAAPALADGDDSGSSDTDDITGVTAPTFGGSAEDGTIVTLYDTDGVTVLGTGVALGGAWRITSTVLTDGVHDLTVRAVDAAGNASPASPVLALTVDTVALAPAALALAGASDSGVKGDGVTHIATPTITGTAEAYAAITLYDTDGATVLGTATADATGAWSITARTLGEGSHTLRAAQTDRAGNTSAPSAGLALTIAVPPSTPPSTPTQPPVQPPSTVIDGVPVQEKPVTLPGGGSGAQLVIPVIAPERDETTGNADVADIPLALSGGDTLLLAQLPAGFGLSAAGGASRPASDALEQLIAAIRAATPGHAAGDQAHLVGNGADFLGLLAGGTPLLVQTITPTAATAPSGTLTLTGTDAQRTALVIDASDLPAGSKLALDAVDFAAIVGSVDLHVGAGSQIVTGDAASQRITVAADNHGAVYAGGGSDMLVVAGEAAAMQRAADGGATLLHGGLGADVAVFGGKLADYLIERHESYLVVADRAQPEQRALVVNVESLQFADTHLALDYRDAQAAIAGLYRTVFERQADYLGIDFWVTAEKNGLTLGSIALELIASAEAQALGAGAFNGDAGHDVELLYRNIFGRQGDAEGLAFWTHAMAQGASLESVAGAFMQSAEIAVHEIGVADWDFTVG